MENKLIPQHNFETKIEDSKTELVTLSNRNGVVVQITNYGARIVSFIVKDAGGIPRDIIAGPATIADYLSTKERYFNAVIGRYAGRIANGAFTLDEQTYKTTQNDGPNTLHGGRGTHDLLWEITARKKDKLRLECVLEDGQDGFPGRLEIAASYILTDENELSIEYFARSDKDTVINLTNHAFFNLGAPDILGHRLMIDAASYTPLNNARIPTGDLAPVKNTVFDFRQFKEIGKDIKDIALKPTKGYDHNFVLDNYPSRNGEPFFAAAVKCPQTGLCLEVRTLEPGLQLYTGNYLSGKDLGKEAAKYPQYSALCLETQHFPDSPNHPDFPTTTLKEGEEFYSRSIYKVLVEPFESAP